MLCSLNLLLLYIKSMYVSIEKYIKFMYKILDVKL
nr:MAG TPA: hypothetical protein [Caudoviricetes sp.]